jgi:hypothetical protein
MTQKKQTKGRVTLYVTWDMEPSYKNRLEMEKILAHTCHELGVQGKLSWEDVPFDYSYRIDLNLVKKQQNKKTKEH